MRLTQAQVWLVAGLAGALAGCVRGGYNLSGGPSRRDSRTDGVRIEGGRRDGTRDVPLARDGSAVPGTWATVSSGSFAQGAPPSDPCRQTDGDEDVRQVTLTHSFQIMVQEVTQARFQAVRGYNPSQAKTCGATCPVENVTWSEAVAYCNALSAMQGLQECYTCSGAGASVTCTVAPGLTGSALCSGYRLPTDSEWELAARAGTTTSLYSGDLTSCNGKSPAADIIAWYLGNTSGDAPRPVGTKAANALGLYDMSGNVSEWVHDWHQDPLPPSPMVDPAGPASGSERCRRGGAFYDEPRFIRSAARDAASPTTRSAAIGLRCARTL